MRTCGTDGRKLDIDRLVECVNDAGTEVAARMRAALAQSFPEIIWTTDYAGLLRTAVHADYRP